MKEYFHDPYGCTASITQTRTGKFQLRLCIPNGACFFSKTYATYRGARIALGKHSDGMREKKEEH